MCRQASTRIVLAADLVPRSLASAQALVGWKLAHALPTRNLQYALIVTLFALAPYRILRGWPAGGRHAEPIRVGAAFQVFRGYVARTRMTPYRARVPFFGHKSRREREWDEVRSAAQDDLVALGDDIRALDVDIAMPDVTQDAKDRYEQALQAYQRASEVFDRAHRPEDLAPVSETLEEGRFAMACAKALLEGRPPPEHRAPCFFDPRHGPSTDDVEWAPPGGTPRPVPACAADATRIRDGFAPHGRQVAVNGRQTEYWNAPRHFGPMMGGYFNGFGGGSMVSALLVGSALGVGLGLGGEMAGGLFGDGDGDGGDGDGGDGGDGGGFGGDGGGFGGDGGDFGGGGDF